MTAERIAQALRRLQSILQRRALAGIAADAAALSRWQGGACVLTRHLNGTQVVTDLPTTLGGAAQGTTPGWLLRAGLSACLATSIAMCAAVADIELSELEVDATSRSDARGLLAMRDAGGRIISPAPLDMQLSVRIAARNVGTSRLRALVEESRRESPVFAALVEPMSIAMHIETPER